MVEKKMGLLNLLIEVKATASVFFAVKLVLAS